MLTAFVLAAEGLSNTFVDQEGQCTSYSTGLYYFHGESLTMRGSA